MRCARTDTSGDTVQLAHVARLTDNGQVPLLSLDWLRRLIAAHSRQWAATEENGEGIDAMFRSSGC